MRAEYFPAEACASTTGSDNIYFAGGLQVAVDLSVIQLAEDAA